MKEAARASPFAAMIAGAEQSTVTQQTSFMNRERRLYTGTSGGKSDEDEKSRFRQHSVSHKLVISSCKAVAKEHLILRYNFDLESFEVLPLAPIQLNG